MSGPTSAATTRRRGRSRRSPPGPAPSPAAPTSSSAPGRARRRCPTRSSRSTASPGSAASTRPTAGLRLGALVTHAEIESRRRSIRERFTGLADACAIVGSHATRASGTIGGNVMNASPAMDTGRAAALPRRHGELRSPARHARRSRSTSSGRGPARRSRAAGRAARRASTLPAPAAGTGSAYVRLEYRRQMEIAVVGAAAVVTLDGRRGRRRAASRITALAPTIHRVAEAEAGARRHRRRRGRGRRGRGRGAQRRRDADLRRPRLGRLPPGHGRA